ncbi:MAG: hypothetical protein ABIP34_21225 [Rhodoferax sp.]|uniref:hypothetical protein n=1 Tax=Rhodoferax sp. TaxID=50421 RepID=UPI0032670D23
MTSSPLTLKQPLAWRTSADLLARLWQRCTRRSPPDTVPVGALGNHLLRDMDAFGQVHGQAREHSELARYDRQQARRGAGFKI